VAFLFLLNVPDLYQWAEQILMLGRFFETTVARAQPFSLYENSMLTTVDKTSIMRNVIQ
jgi:hypothetical protein